MHAPAETAAARAAATHMNASHSTMEPAHGDAASMEAAHGGVSVKATYDPAAMETGDCAAMKAARDCVAMET